MTRAVLALFLLLVAGGLHICVSDTYPSNLFRFAKLADKYPFHYGFDIYRGFDVERALQNWQEQRFDINYYDPFRGRVMLGGSVKLFESSVQQVVHQLCQGLVDEVLRQADSQALLRCAIAATRTVAMRKVQVIANISQYYSFAPYEDEIFASLFAYESLPRSALNSEDASITQPVAGTACLLGAPSPHLILPMLTSPAVNSIRVFSRPGKMRTDSLEAPAPDDTWESKDIFRAAAVFRKSVDLRTYSALLEEYWQQHGRGSASDASALMHACDFVHVAANIMPASMTSDNYVESILPLIRFLSKQRPARPAPNKDQQELLSTARVVWQTPSNQEHSGSDGPASDRIEWKWSLSWFSLSFQRYAQDTNGFVFSSSAAFSHSKTVTHVTNSAPGSWQSQKPWQFSTIRVGVLKSADQMAAEKALAVGYYGESSVSAPQSRNSVLFIITVAQRANIELALALLKQLQTVGYENTIVFPDMNIDGFEHYERLAKQHNLRIVHIAFAPTAMEILYRRFVIFHQESLDATAASAGGDADWLMDAGRGLYAHLLAQAQMIWHFDEAGLDILKGMTGKSREKKTFVAPVMHWAADELQAIEWHNALPPFSDIPTSRDSETKSLLVFFMPEKECSARELDVLRSLSIKKATVTAKGLSVTNSGTSDSKIKSNEVRSIDVRAFCLSSAYYDYEREYLLQRAHVILALPIDDSPAALSMQSLRALSRGIPLVALDHHGAANNTGTLISQLRDAVLTADSVNGLWTHLQSLANDEEALLKQKSRMIAARASLTPMFADKIDTAAETSKKFAFSKP